MAGEERAGPACTGGSQSVRLRSSVRILVLGWSELCRAAWLCASDGLWRRAVPAALEASQ